MKLKKRDKAYSGGAEILFSEEEFRHSSSGSVRTDVGRIDIGNHSAVISLAQTWASSVIHDSFPSGCHG